MLYEIAIFAWLVLLIAAIPYTQHAKHPSAPRLAAWLLFVGVLSVSAAAFALVLLFLAGALGLSRALDHPAMGVLFVAAVFLLAFPVARRQLRRPPRRVSPR
ncbi:MAG TPA: hypothetical protein VLY46_12225 [Usitatibacter sp.]|nr:hypothetical protein [Usitatibacter sp.]